MYLIVKQEQFPNHPAPVVSYHREETRDDAFMKARCVRDDARDAGHNASVEVHRLDSTSRLVHFDVSATRRKRVRP